MNKVLVLLLFFCSNCFSQVNQINSYDIGSPALNYYWVDPVNGNDAFSGTSASPFKTVTHVWNLISSNPTTGIQINLKAGTYPVSSLPNYWENKHGTFNAPIILRAIDGDGTVNFLSDINAFSLTYFYVIGVRISNNADAFHAERCSHVLLRNVILDGGNYRAHETLKVNQSQHIYIENSDIFGADDNAIDFVSVQYGHIINSKVHNASDWCIYNKGGSAYITIANNEIYNCGTGGFTAGQGTGFEFMDSPWLHYEAYDLKIFNNIIHDTEGAGLGVNGGYNILMAYNTLYRVGSRSHALEFVYGERSCDGNASACTARNSVLGWGPGNPESEVVPIPNKNVYFYNNIIYNPAGFSSQWQHFTIGSARTAPSGSNLTTVYADNNLQIKGNIIWNGSSDLALGTGDDSGCQDSNPSCNASQIRSQNSINVLQPQLIDPAGNDFRPIANSNIFSVATYVVPEFLDGREASPVAPPGNLNNSIAVDRGNTPRDINVAGAYSSANSSVGGGNPPVPPIVASKLRITSFVLSSKNLKKNQTIKVTVKVNSSSFVSSLLLKIGTTNLLMKKSGNNTYTKKYKLLKAGRFNVKVVGKDRNNKFVSSSTKFIVVK